MKMIFIVQKRKNQEFLKAVSNITVFSALSVFLLLLSLSVSGNRGLILSDRPSDFLSEPIFMRSVLFPICTAPVFGFDGRHEMEQFVGIGFFPYLALIPLLPIVKSISERGCVLIDKADNTFLLKLGTKKRNIYKTIIVAALYFAAVRMILNCVLPFHVMTEVLINSLLLIAIVGLMIICIRNPANRMLEPESIDISLRLLIIGIMLYFPFVSIVSIFIYYILINRSTDRVLTVKQSLCHAVSFAAFFFVIMGAGDEHVLARLLSYVPVIGDFRFLYKCAFIYIPLVIICGAVSLDSVTCHAWLIKSITITCSLTSLIGIVYIIHSGIHPYINNHFYDYHCYRETASEVESRLEETGIDRDYRFVVFLDPQLLDQPQYTILTDVPIPFWRSWDPGEKEFNWIKTAEDIRLYSGTEVSSKICTYGMTKNLSTFYGTYSIAGYDNVFSEKSFRQTDQLMNDMYREGMMTNASFQLDNLLSEKASSDLSEFQEQMINNSIKYVVVDESCMPKLIGVIEGCPELSIKKSNPWFGNYILVELDGVLPICTDTSFRRIPVESSLDSLLFRTDYDTECEVMISMTYDDHYMMEITGTDGSVKTTPVSETADGYLKATVPAGRQVVRLVYKNAIMDMAVILAIITSVLAVISIVVLSRKPVTEDMINTILPESI